MKVIGKLIDWVRFDSKYVIGNIRDGINNLIYWFPIIWKDRDYDHHYIFEVLKTKLKKQAFYLKKHDRHTRVDFDVRNINICISLIDKLQNDTYSGEYLDYQSHYYNFIPTDNSNYKELKIDVVWEDYDSYFKKYPLIYKKVLNGAGTIPLKGREDDKTLIAMSIAKYNQDRAKKLLFKVLEENIEFWWD